MPQSVPIVMSIERIRLSRQSQHLYNWLPPSNTPMRVSYFISFHIIVHFTFWPILVFSKSLYLCLLNVLYTII